MLLSIETSCDETAIALFDAQGRLLHDLISSQIALHVPYGGVVPELAARAHLTNLQLLMEELSQLEPGFEEKLQAVAVTQGPGLKGCLLVGLSFAKGYAYRLGLPLLPVNHLEGHLLAGSLLEEGERPEFPFLALLVSGGHSQLIYARAFQQYEILAETLDDAVGEAFDKCATLLGLSYPGGPALSRLAEQGNPEAFSFPVGLKQENAGFSFSGLKTAVQREVKKQGEGMSHQTRADLAASVEKALVDSLVPKTLFFAKAKNVNQVLLTGGVAANRQLRERLKESLSAIGVQTIILPNRWCGDNAAMIGVAARHRMGESGFQIPSTSSWLSVDALPRFPLEEITHG